MSDCLTHGTNSRDTMHINRDTYAPRRTSSAATPDPPREQDIPALPPRIPSPRATRVARGPPGDAERGPYYPRSTHLPEMPDGPDDRNEDETAAEDVHDVEHPSPLQPFDGPGRGLLQHDLGDVVHHLETPPRPRKTIPASRARRPTSVTPRRQAGPRRYGARFTWITSKEADTRTLGTRWPATDAPRPSHAFCLNGSF